MIPGANRAPYLWIYIGLSVLVFFLITKEAWVLPLTHDEGNTIYCSQTSFWDIVSYADPVPNNHILNTLLIKCNQWLFGESLFAARLHNVLFGFLYVIFSFKLLKYLNLDNWLKFNGFVLLVFQPYLLDFFSVTRGYGLSISLMMMSFYFFVKRMDTHKTNHLVWSWVLMSLGVYANFTLLNVYVPFFFILAAHSYIRRRDIFLKELMWLSIVGLILLAASVIPLYKMMNTSQFVYWGTSGFLKDTWYPLIQALRSGVQYNNVSSHSLGNVVILCMILTVIGAGVISHRKKKWHLEFILFTALGLGILLYNHLQFYFLNVPFLNARTALFMWPVMTLVYVTSFHYIVKYKPQLGLPPLVFISALISYHFLMGYKVDENHEWSYDRHTYRLIEELRDIKHREGQTPSLNCYWIYYPSLSYHIPQLAEEEILLAPWGTKVQSDNTYEYYYTEFSELESLQSEYDIIKDFGGAYLLMRK